MESEEVLYNISKSFENVFEVVADNPLAYHPFFFESYLAGGSVLVRLLLKHLIGDQIPEDKLIEAIDKALEEIRQRGATETEMEGATITAMHTFAENGLLHEAQKRHENLESLGIDVGLRLV